VTSKDVLDHHALGYAYDDDPLYEIARIDEVTEAWMPFSFTTTYSTTPAVFAAMQTFNGKDTANIRLRNVQETDFEIRLKEEKSLDDEMKHAAETIGYFAASPGTLCDATGEAIGEIVRTQREQPSSSDWETVQLAESYENPVVIMKIGSTNGGNPAHIRIREVTTTSFEYQIEEWTYQDGYHKPEDIFYLVLEAGRHTLADGTILEAGTVETDDAWVTGSFTSSFDDLPVVLTHCQTRNGGDPVVTRNRNIDNAGFEVRLQEEEAKGDHKIETIGYVALLSNS